MKKALLVAVLTLVLAGIGPAGCASKPKVYHLGEGEALVIDEKDSVLSIDSKGEIRRVRKR